MNRIKCRIVNCSFMRCRDCYIIFLYLQTSLSSSVWGSVNTNPCTNWGSDSSSIWGDTHNSNMGFWDEAVKEATQPPPQTKKGNAQKNNKGNANLRYFFQMSEQKNTSHKKKLSCHRRDRVIHQAKDFCFFPVFKRSNIVTQ